MKMQSEEKYFLLTVFFLFAVLFTAFTYLKRALWFDEAIYIGMGKWFFSLGRIGIFDEIRPLIFPIWVGFLWKLGLNPRFSSIFFNSAFLLVSSILIFKMSKPLREFRVFAVAMFLINFLVLKFGSLVLTEPLAVLLSLLAMYFFLEKKYYLFGFFSALTFLTRFPFGLVLAVGLTQLWFFSDEEKLRNSLKILTSFIITASPYFIFNYFKYWGHVLRPFKNALIAINGAPKNNNLFFYPLTLINTNFLFVFSFIPILILSCYFLFKKFKGKKVLKKGEFRFLIFNIIALLFFLIYFTHVSHKEQRYAISMIPYVSMLSAWGISFIYKKTKHLLNLKIRRIINEKFAVAGILVLVIIISSIAPFKILNLYFKHPQRTDYFFNQNLTNARNFVVDELKNYSLNNSDIILTNDVAFTYYTNNKIVSIVFPKMTLKILNINENKSGFIIINNCYLQCFTESCYPEKKKILSVLREHHLLFKSPKFGNCYYTVYKNKRAGN